MAARPPLAENGRPTPRESALRRLLPILALLLVLPALALAQSFTPEQRQEVIGILREALRSDPSILREAVAAMEQADDDERAGRASRGIATHRAALERNPADPVRGNPQGAITLVEFFDARCPYCKRMPPVLTELLRRQRDVRLVSKDLPILGPNSVLASRALLAAQRQGRYAEYQEALLRSREELTEPVLKREAEKLGLNWSRLRAEMDAPEIRDRLAANLALARELGIEGTPAFVIGDRLVPGALDLATLEALVAEARRPR